MEFQHTVTVDLPYDEAVTRVRVMDPQVMTAFEGTEALAPVADDASRRPRAVLDALPAPIGN